MRFHGLRRRGALVAMLLAATAGTASAQAGRLIGLVRDEFGQPIKGAIVVAENPDVRRSSVTVTTNDKGRFGMIGLPSGVWMLSVQAPGFAAQGGPVIVRQTMNSGTPIRFALKKVVAPQSALGSVAAKDIQTALGGADTLFGEGDDDLLFGDSGTPDSCSGGAGDDTDMRVAGVTTCEVVAGDIENVANI